MRVEVRDGQTDAVLVRCTARAWLLANRDLGREELRRCWTAWRAGLAVVHGGGAAPWVVTVPVPSSPPRTLRFWVHGPRGPVRLKLRPGQAVEWSQGGYHEEGTWGEWARWEASEDGRSVSVQSTRTGTDCDGRHRDDWDGWTWAEDLDAVEGSPDFGETRGLRFPRWRRERAEVYDAYARAAGY